MMLLSTTTNKLHSTHLKSIQTSSRKRLLRLPLKSGFCNFPLLLTQLDLFCFWLESQSRGATHLAGASSRRSFESASAGRPCRPRFLWIRSSHPRPGPISLMTCIVRVSYYFSWPHRRFQLWTLVKQKKARSRANEKKTSLVAWSLWLVSRTPFLN